MPTNGLDTRLLRLECMPRGTPYRAVVDTTTRRPPSWVRPARVPSTCRTIPKGRAQSSGPYLHTLVTTQYVPLSPVQGRKQSAMASYVVYCLVSEVRPTRTYIGSTNNTLRRWKQHNGLCVGGARATRAYRPWRPAIVVTGLRTRSEACRVETAWRRTCRRHRWRGLGGRWRALEHMWDNDRLRAQTEVQQSGASYYTLPVEDERGVAEMIRRSHIRQV